MRMKGSFLEAAKVYCTRRANGLTSFCGREGMAGVGLVVAFGE